MSKRLTLLCSALLTVLLIARCMQPATKSPDATTYADEKGIANELARTEKQFAEAARRQAPDLLKREPPAAVPRLLRLDRSTLEEVWTRCDTTAGPRAKVAIALTKEFEVERVVVLDSTGSTECDAALVMVLTRSQWMCENASGKPCTFEMYYGLPPKAHRQNRSR